MIKLKRVGKSYDGALGLAPVSLRIKKGEFVAISGKSGVGKSSLLHLLGLLTEADSGAYYFRNKNVRRYSQKEKANLRNQEISLITQRCTLIEDETGAENIKTPLYFSKYSLEEMEYRCREVITELQLYQLEDKLVSEMTAAEKKRIEIARGIVTKPSLVIADEPTGGLDRQNSADIMAILSGLHKSGKTIVIGTHQVRIAQQCRRLIRLNPGQVEPLREQVKRRRRKRKSRP